LKRAAKEPGDSDFAGQTRMQFAWLWVTPANGANHPLCYPLCARIFPYSSISPLWFDAEGRKTGIDRVSRLLPLRHDHALDAVSRPSPFPLQPE